MLRFHLKIEHEAVDSDPRLSAAWLQRGRRDRGENERSPFSRVFLRLTSITSGSLPLLIDSINNDVRNINFENSFLLLERQEMNCAKESPVGQSL
jgi:hypothetical protein